MTTTARISAVLLSFGLMAGCATMSDEDSPAAMAIAAAKAANKEAAALDYEWRDTGQAIKAAEAALDADNEAEALRQANNAKKQANDAIGQANHENEKYLNSLSKEDRAALEKAMAALANADNTPAPKKRATVGGRVTSYSVVGGDNLWDISGKSSVYDNPYQWPLIYKANRSKINDADLIYPGQRLDIDQDVSGSDINAAVNHAKTRGAWSVGDVEQSDRGYLSR